MTTSHNPELANRTAPPLPLAESGKATGADTAPLTWPRVPLSRRNAVWVLAAFTLGAVLGACVGPARQRATPAHSQPPATLPDSTATVQTAADTVGALGRLMPEGDTTTLAPPSGAGDARIARWLVGEGERVTAGQPVAELDNLPQRLILRDTAAAEVAVSQAALAKTRSEARLGWAEAQAASRRAHATHLVATQDLDRIAALVPVGVTTQAQLDQARATLAGAGAEQAKAEAALQRYAHRDANAQPDVQLALGNLRVAQAALAQAEQAVTGARVTASLDGTLIAVHARAGEKPGERGIATLGNVDRMAAELEVYQTDIRRVAVGQQVVMTSAALGAPLFGTVAQVGMVVQRQAVLASDPVSHTDARVVMVKVVLDPPSSGRARALTGLQITASIAVGTP